MPLLAAGFTAVNYAINEFFENLIKKCADLLRLTA